MCRFGLSRLVVLIPLLFALFIPAFAQNTRLTYRPIRAEWSTPLQRIVMVSASPNQLHLFDPVTGTTQSVALGAAPVSLSIAPSGLHAAVGHAGSASYVDLPNRSVSRVLTYPAPMNTQATEIVLAREWLYVFPTNYEAPVSIKLSDGSSQRANYLTFLSNAALHPSGTVVYAAQSGGGSSIRFPLSPAGPLANPIEAHTSLSHCGSIWFSPDGSRAYQGCGVAARVDAVQPDELNPIGPFFTAQVRAFVESVAGRIATIPQAPSSSSTSSSSSQSDTDKQVVLLAANGFSELGRLGIPKFTIGARDWLGQGRWVFFNSSGSTLYVIYQAEISSGILNDFAVQTYPLDAPASCTATFGIPTISVAGEGALRTVDVQSASECIYRAASSVDWIQVVKGGFGSGDASMTLHVRANPGTAARTGSVTLGAQTLQVSQAGRAPDVPAQQIFSYKVLDAAYSKPLDRMVLLSRGPDELHLYDPLTRAEQVVALSYQPLSLSVSPNGLKAAVGHWGFVSLVNLQTRTVEKVIASDSPASVVLLTGDEWIYTFSGYAGQVIEIATNAVRQLSVFGFSSQVTSARLHSSGSFAYVGLNYNWSRVDVRNGGTTISSPPSSNSSCGNVWVSEDGRRLYTACGAVFRSSETPSEDGVVNGALSGATQTSVTGIAHSSARQQIALVTSGNYPYAAADVQLYADDGLLVLGRLLLQDRSDGISRLRVKGRWVFWNQAANRLFAITQIDPAQISQSQSGTFVPLSDHAVEVLSPDVLAACTVTATPETVDVPGAGGTVPVTVTTGAGCVWAATVGSSGGWVRLPGSNYSHVGTGPGTLQVTVDRNFTSAERTATLTIGGNSLLIRQPLPPPLSVSAALSIYSSIGGFGYVSVTATGAGIPWSAVSNAIWITIQNGPSFVGTSQVQFRVDANTGVARVGTITVAGEAVRVEQAGTAQAGGMRFVPISPCRVVDTRGETGQTGAFGTPIMEPGSQRNFPIPQGACNIPTMATAYSLNATVVPRGGLSYLTLWPTGQGRPLVSTLNSFDGRIKANAAIVPAGTGGGVSAFVTDRTDVIFDINGYFIPASSSSNSTGFALYAMTPCRVADTRGTTGPSMNAGQTRNFAILGACNSIVPGNAVAYSLNVTVVPKSGPLSYVTMWPAGAAQPVVSTLNAPTGTVVANAAIVPSGVGGAISVYSTDAADIVIDINGYFAGAGSLGADLLFYPVTPCRVSDSRSAAGAFGGPALAAGSTRSYTVPSSNCNIPATARAYSMNATVVPASGALAYLTMWPVGQSQPVVSTLNSFDASVVANALLLPAGTNAAINAYVTNLTDLILDINGYFAQ